MKSLINLVLYVSVFLGSFYLPTDPDMGWHLKYGEFFVKTGSILKENIYSTMMPDYKWVNHSWASDVLIYLSYQTIGFFGIILLGAFVVTLTYYFFSRAFNLSLWDKVILFPVILFLGSNVNAISFRSQQLSYLFTGILFFIISLYNKNPRMIFLTIPLFLVWANFHGGFILGLLLFVGYIFIKKAIELKEDFNIKEIPARIKYEMLAVIGVFIATLVNPFGLGVYSEALNHFGNPWLKYVSEWAPFSDQTSQWWNLIIFINLYIIGSIVLFLTGKLKPHLPVLILTIPLIALSFYERRYAWSMYYLSIPILVGVSEFIKPKTRPNQLKASAIISLIFLATVLMFKIPFEKYLSMTWKQYCRSSAILCSYDAMDYLSRNGLSKDLSTPYAWGGWMIWNFPNIKPSIDGRMHLWEDENGYSAFAEYYKNVQDWESIDNSKYNVVLALRTKPVYKRLLKLSEERKWRLVYRDSVSSVFVRSSSYPVPIDKK